ncbi:MAG TPA: NAD(P)-dependent oxidoreductase [Candidatus Sulfotelmatobacter sp.]|nr:NAD(P)-dependent oxidoreductase [Candidatus Sulfotelmatobacter sp.]
MKSEILVTGATGFLGRYLVKALEARGYSVRSHSSRQGDIANCPLPIEGIDHVFHLAAKTFVPESWTNPEGFYRTNVMGTVNVLEHCRANRTPLTLLSSYVYGHPQRLPISEDHPLGANNPYAHTKVLAEEAGRFYEMDFGMRVVIVRPFNMYGPGQKPPFLIPTIVEQAMDDSRSDIRLKDLRPRRDYLYVDDAIEFLLLTLGKNVKGVYNLGSGESASVAEVAELIRHAVGTDKPVVSDEQPRPQEVMDVRADISRAASELGWHPTTSLAKGIREVVEARRAHRE